MVSTVQVIYSLGIGGAERLAVTIASHLDRKRFRPAICALDGGGVLGEELANREIPYEVMWRRGLDAGVLARLYRCFRREKAQIVHTHQFPQLLFSLLPARLAGARVVHTEHEFYVYRTDARARHVFKWLLPFCSAFTVVGADLARYYTDELGVPAQRINVISNGVDLDGAGSVDGSARRELGFSRNEVVFGIVGRLEPEKDHRTLLQAFRKVIDSRQSARLLVIGDGSLRRDLESYSRSLGIARNATFLGARMDIPELLTSIDVFVLSSINEGVPLSVIEAMAAAKPVIATNVGGLPLLVKHGVNGTLVPPRDVIGLAEAMECLAGNPSLREAMGKRSHDIARESFSVVSMLERYENLYAAVAG